MIDRHEIETAEYCIRTALEKGADSVRVSLSKSVMDSCTVLNGKTDKIAHSADRSIYLYIFADSRYGTFSTNRLEAAELEKFIEDAVKMVQMLGKDEYRRLPDMDRTAADALTGTELELCDMSWNDTEVNEKLDLAASMSIYGRAHGNDYRIISEECEYSDSMEDTFLIDSQGFRGRHTETSFNCFTEITIEDREGNKYSGFWWESSPMVKDLKVEACSEAALKKAVGQIGPRRRRSGTYRMVVDRNASSRLVAPLFSALNAASIQQKMSFLEETLGKKVFSEGLTIIDMARTPGMPGSRLFDTEGVATKEGPVIENGVVKQYFVNTYLSAKMGIPPTVEDVSRPCLMSYIKDEDLSSKEKDVSLEDILRYCRNGIYVTGFNGGNCNPVTGDFSFGIEGYSFTKGEIAGPVREMLITGNIVELWNSLIAAGNDARRCARWQIPTLAFENVSFSA